MTTMKRGLPSSRLGRPAAYVILLLSSQQVAWCWILPDHLLRCSQQPRQTDSRVSASNLPALHLSSRPSYWSEESDFDPVDDNFSDDFDDFSKKRDVMEWERCPTATGTAHVLLPPPAVDLPYCVIHFTGGTFFGSSPALWYQQLLEDIVRHTQAAVVATSIPVTLLQSPLQHVSLSKKLQRQFHTAWREVLLDEYGEDIKQVPVCGLGHSLGARLMVVSSTLKAAREKAFSPPPYKSYILISFTNHEASTGIPGLAQLNKASRRIEEKAAVADYEATRSRRRRERDDRFYEDEDDDDDDDFAEDWGELFDELQEALRTQATRLQNALTPASQKLELYPSPDQLWKALVEDGRYFVPQTLVVQFDDDRTDQSSKLAVAIAVTSDVKFARLRGTHLTPVSVQGNDGGTRLREISSRAGRILWRLLAGRRQSGSNEDALRDLRQTVARYITEIVTKN